MEFFDDNIYRCILSATNLETLLVTCRPLRRGILTLVDEEVSHRIGDVFAWFVTDVTSMRNCMRDNAAFIGGSLALSYFSPVSFVPSNVDLFVPFSRHDALVMHLVAEEGYSIRSNRAILPAAPLPTHPSQDFAVAVYGAGLNTITKLRRGTRSVRVFTTVDPVPFRLSVDCVTLSWSTAVFNFISADVAGCAYPALTFRARALYHAQRFLRGMPGTSSSHSLNTYCERGFEFSQHPNWWFEPLDKPCPESWSCPLRIRTFGDRGTLLIPPDHIASERVSREWMFGSVVQNLHDV